MKQDDLRHTVKQCEMKRLFIINSHKLYNYFTDTKMRFRIEAHHYQICFELGTLSAYFIFIDRNIKLRGGHPYVDFSVNGKLTGIIPIETFNSVDEFVKWIIELNPELTKYLIR